MVGFLSSDAFVTVFSVVVAAASLFWALRADTGKRIDKLEERLVQRIDKGDEALGQRIDRQEERARANHKELVGKIGELAGEIGELKAAVGAVNARLDERSSPRPLVVREAGEDYQVGGESTDSSETPEGDSANVAGDTGESGPATDLRAGEQSREG